MSDENNDDLQNDYDQAGFGGDLGLGENPALILVDFMMAYYDKDAPLYAGVEAELAQAKKLLTAARAAGIPVFFSRVEYKNDQQAAKFRKKVSALNALTPGSYLGSLHPDIAPLEGEPVLVKQYASSFFGTDLDARLKAINCDSLLITGVTTSGCIRATALDALQNEFTPVVVEDACGDRDERVQQANIFDLSAKYAEIAKTDQIIDYLNARKKA